MARIADGLNTTELSLFVVIKVTDKNGSVTQNTYDAAGNLITNRITKGNQSDTLIYAYTNGGLLSSISNGAGSVSYTYNNKSHLGTYIFWYHFIDN